MYLITTDVFVNFTMKPLFVFRTGLRPPNNTAVSLEIDVKLK